MNKVKITVLKITTYNDLIEKYENPINDPCPYKVGDEFMVTSPKKPDGLCENSWKAMKDYVISLLNGKGNFFDNWMKNPLSCMVSCDDGFRPVTFYIEVVK